MNWNTIAGWAVAANVIVLVLIAKAGDINPPEGPIAPTGQTLSTIHSAASSFGSADPDVFALAFIPGVQGSETRPGLEGGYRCGDSRVAPISSLAQLIERTSGNTTYGLSMVRIQWTYFDLSMSARHYPPSRFVCLGEKHLRTQCLSSRSRSPSYRQVLAAAHASRANGARVLIL